MVKKTRKEYDAAFKREAVRLASEPGVKDRAVEKDLGLYQGAIRHWRSELEADSKTAFPGVGHLKPQDEELRQLRRERDILKKAAAYFSMDEHAAKSAVLLLKVVDCIVGGNFERRLAFIGPILHRNRPHTTCPDKRTHATRESNSCRFHATIPPPPLVHTKPPGLVKYLHEYMSSRSRSCRNIQSHRRTISPGASGTPKRSPGGLFD